MFVGHWAAWGHRVDPEGAHGPDGPVTPAPVGAFVVLRGAVVPHVVYAVVAEMTKMKFYHTKQCLLLFPIRRTLVCEW